MAKRSRKRIPKRNIAVLGLDELMDQLDGLTTENLWGPVGDAALNAVKLVELTARSMARSHRVTGDFEDGFQSFLYKKRQGKGITGFVRWSHRGIEPYNRGVLIEFGTSKTPALGIFSKAWASTKRDVIGSFEEDVKEALDKALS